MCILYKLFKIDINYKIIIRLEYNKKFVREMNYSFKLKMKQQPNPSK